MEHPPGVVGREGRIGRPGLLAAHEHARVVEMRKAGVWRGLRRGVDVAVRHVPEFDVIIDLEIEVLRRERRAGLFRADDGAVAHDHLLDEGGGVVALGPVRVVPAVVGQREDTAGVA